MNVCDFKKCMQAIDGFRAFDGIRYNPKLKHNLVRLEATSGEGMKPCGPQHGCHAH